ncbi:MAG TPA: alpha/beta fold hydrolase [Gemmatimonadaceae bacterium]|nr:alpha/beta fold hydrolase [Gemmatimonadaceae bacterium]
MTETIRIGDLTVLCKRPHLPTRPPVLFVHGYFADATIFEAWLDFFAARGVPSYAVNLRGRAGSRPGIDLGRASIEDFADDASVVAKTLDKPAVVGHSMGGLIAQKLAERGDVSAAVLVTPAPPRGISVLSPKVAIKQLRYLPRILTSRVVVPDREDLRSLILNHVPAELQDAILDRLIPDSGRAGRDMSVTGVPVDAARVRCPVLAITTDDDHFIPGRIVERIARRYSATLHILKTRGHMLLLEPGWGQIADLIDHWIRDHTIKA